MKKSRRICSVICACLMLFLTACSGRTDVGSGDSYIYGLNSDRTGLVKISYSITEEDALDAAEGVLQEMKAPAEEIEYTSALP